MESFDTIFKSAMAALESSKYPEAITLYKKAIAIDNTDPRPWSHLGVCLMELKHWDEAIKVLTKAIELKPHYGEASLRLYLAQSLEKSGNAMKARTQWEIVSKMPSVYPDEEAINEARRELGL